MTSPTNPTNLERFLQSVYTIRQEAESQMVDGIVSASRGAIIMTSGTNAGDYSESAMYGRIPGLLRFRDPYDNDPATDVKALAHIVDRSVKVAVGTHQVDLSPSLMTWIGRDPEEAGAVVGRQIAEDSMTQRLNTAIMSVVAACSQVADVTHDASSGVLTQEALLGGARKFGDRYQVIGCWLMTSKSAFDLWGQAIANQQNLFTFGTVNIKADPFGRPLIITDSPKLIIDETPDKYWIAGLQAGAVAVVDNGDYFQNVSTVNGPSNIKRTLQAEWTFQLGLRGFAWDKANGGPAPLEADLATPANWDRYATSHKDLPGVLVKTL